MHRCVCMRANDRCIVLTFSDKCSGCSQAFDAICCLCLDRAGHHLARIRRRVEDERFWGEVEWRHEVSEHPSRRLTDHDEDRIHI